MKKIILTFLLISISSSFLLAQSDEDKTKIKNCALDYIEGWYEGNPERMERALHPDLAKRVIRPDKETGERKVQHMTAETLIGYTEKAYGKNTPPEKQQKDVTILDVYENIACVKIVAADWIDYLQVGKINDEWKIINVLWELKPKK